MILELVDSGTIQGARSQAFHCFWRAELWPQLTSHVTRVEMAEERECWQRYALHVHVDGKDYTMETQRIAVPSSFITFYQPKPPYFMRTHSGVWRFEDDDAGNTLVTVSHRVDVDEAKAIEALGARSLDEARKMLLNNLHKNGMAMITSVDAFLQARASREQSVALAAD
jgi:polyketide cyclase/dehydrase/lipid transport protein